MTEMNANDNITLAVVVSELGHLRKSFEDDRKERREDFDKFREEFRTFSEDKVSRREWMQRNETVDKRFEGLGEDVSEIKQDAAGRRLPWTAVVGAVAGIGALLVSLIVAVATFSGA